MKKIYFKILKTLLYLIFILSSKMKNQKINDKIANIFIELNNKNVLKELKKRKNDKILILLPHCLQFYTCEYKITSDIENCRRCGKCVVHNFVDIKKKYDKSLEIKVATGGTLARKYVKEIMPSLIIAVACKRDLISGIRDTAPFLVYGIFNKILNEPCINTTVSDKEIYEILQSLDF